MRQTIFFDASELRQNNKKNALHNLHAKRKLKMGTKTKIKDISVCVCVGERVCVCLCVSALYQIDSWGIHDDTIKMIEEMG